MTIRWALYAPESPERISETILIRQDNMPGKWFPGRINDLLGLYWFSMPDGTNHQDAQQLALNWLHERMLI